MMTAITELKTQSRALSAGILNPGTLAEALEMAKTIATSTIIPKDYQGNPGNILVAIQWGLEIGLQPLQAMQNIAVINGRPSLWGDSLLALCKSSPVCEYITEILEEQGDEITAICTAKRRGDPSPVVREFSMTDAKRAGLAGKQGPWSQYPKRMLQMRARGYCLRDAFPDVLRGMAVAEEEQDRPREVSGRSETSGPVKTSRMEQVIAKVAAAKLPPPPVEMNPETGEVPPPVSEVTPVPDITFDQLRSAINACQTVDDVKDLARDGLHLADAEKEELGKLMRAKIKILRAAT